jgi:hypothetical protein
MSNPYTIKALIRRKKFDDSSIDNSKLARVLSIFDLTLLGMKLVFTFSNPYSSFDCKKYFSLNFDQ